MSKRKLRWLCALAALVVAAVAVSFLWRGKTAPDYSTAERFVLYSLDGNVYPTEAERQDPSRFYGYPALGELSIVAASDRRALLGSLYAGMTPLAEPYKCFNPRHGIRIVTSGKTIDYLICFECKQIQIHEGGHVETVPISNTEPPPIFTKLLTDAGIKLAPKS